MPQAARQIVGFNSDQRATLTRARVRARGRTLWLMMVLFVSFGALAIQLVRLGFSRAVVESESRAAMSAPIARTYARPDIVDRSGRLLATDLVGHSLYADPAQIIDADLAVEALLALFPDLDATALREKLSDRSRRFEWIKRGLTPRIAQQANDLGVPGLYLRQEPKRTYPLGRLAGHLLGAVNLDNKGIGGIERYVDAEVGIEPAVSGEPGARSRLRLTIDVGVQHGLEEELSVAMARYRAQAAAGVILDADTGEIAAISSLPQVSPAFVMEAQDPDYIDRMATGRYELGSVFKGLTLALALNDRMFRLEQPIDVSGPLKVGGHDINDLHSSGHWLSLREVFLKSSNVGFGRIGLAIGHDRLERFFERVGLSTQMQSEAGPIARMQLPKHWGEAETATAAFGHGIAVAPLQFAVASAALVNGGWRIAPTVVAGNRPPATRERVISAETSAKIRALWRENVTASIGTGGRADAAGYEVGGKTGTAEQAMGGRYREKSVISSFIAAFPMSKPRYISFVLLFEPKSGEAGPGQITAGLNAAPLTSRIVRRVAPLLGVMPTPDGVN